MSCCAVFHSPTLKYLLPETSAIETLSCSFNMVGFKLFSKYKSVHYKFSKLGEQNADDIAKDPAPDVAKFFARNNKV